MKKKESETAGYDCTLLCQSSIYATLISCKVYFNDKDNNDYVNDNDNNNDNDNDNDNNANNNNNNFRLVRSLLDPSQCYYTETYSIFVGDSLLKLFSREKPNSRAQAGTSVPTRFTVKEKKGWFPRRLCHFASLLYFQL